MSKRQDVSNTWETIFANACVSGLSNEEAALKADAAINFADQWRRKPEEKKRSQTTEELIAGNRLTDPLDLIPNFGDTSLIIRIKKLEVQVSDLHSAISLCDADGGCRAEKLLHAIKPKS
jgi:hypothetical protein